MVAGKQSSETSRGWRRHRKLCYLVVLLTSCGIAYFVWDLLFMPADLRHLQGTWKCVRCIDGGEEVDHTVDCIVINRRRITIKFMAGEWSKPLDIVPERRELLIHEDNEIRIFGLTVPIGVRRDQTKVLRYELDETKLRLSAPRPGEVEKETVHELIRDSD